MPRGNLQGSQKLICDVIITYMYEYFKTQQVRFN